MMRNILLSFSFPVICFVLAGCGKDPAPSTGGTTGSSGTSNGSLAGFNMIPLPTVNVSSGIIPVLADFHVTNKGPYVEMQNSTQQKWSVYKYQGGSGSAAWSSFIPSFQSKFFIPRSFAFEKDNEFSIYWTGVGNADGKYGMYNLNNGTTSFEFDVPVSPKGPGRFDAFIPTRTTLALAWGVSANELWYETAVAVPKTFEKIVDIPTTGGYLSEYFSDPDNGTILWCATQNRLYKVGAVPSTPGAPSIISQWNFSSISTSDYICAIIKVGADIVIQFGNRVYKQNGTSFNLIGTLNIAAIPFVSNICTNGSVIFASDGRYYNSSSGTWASYIGTGANLSAADAVKYNQLKAYCTAGLPIGCVNGSGTGPVYLLDVNNLIQIFPSL